MPYSEYRPDLMGAARLEPTGSFEAGSLQSFTLIYTAGRFGIDDTGSIKIGFRFATDFGPVQFTDPKAQGYTTVEASNGATLETKWEFKRNIRPWNRSLYINVVKDFLAPGDTITIRFGDRRFGSPGIRVQTYCESEFEFHVLVDAIATYDYVALAGKPQDTGSCLARACDGRPFFQPACAQERRSGWRSRSTTSGAIRRIASNASSGWSPMAPFPDCRPPCRSGRENSGRSWANCGPTLPARCRSARSTTSATCCAAPTRCAWCPGTRRLCTSGATPTASRMRRSAPTRRANISSSAVTRRMSMSLAIRATTSRSLARFGAISTR